MHFRESGNKRQEAVSVRKRRGNSKGCFCNFSIQLFGEEVKDENESRVSLFYMWSSLVRTISKLKLKTAVCVHLCWKAQQLNVMLDFLKCFFNFLCIRESIKKRVAWKCEAVQLFSTLIIIRNVSWAAYYYDFWRSCDTEDWSNDAENTALITEINYFFMCIRIENCYFKL